MASFSTISLMLEAPDVVRVFADYYRRAGAEEVIVFWDGPLPDEAAAIEGVSFVACDAAFWESEGMARPAVVLERQYAVAQAGMRRCGSDWALLADADEFVFGDRSISAFLDAIPPQADAVSVPTAEAVWGPGDEMGKAFACTHFRLAWRRRRWWAVLRWPVYGSVGRHLQAGLTGHSAGKQFLRVGRRYSRILCHSAQRDGQGLTRRAASFDPALAGMYVGHFDAGSLPRWVEKWRRRNAEGARWMPARRRAQMEAILARIARGEGAARSVFAAFNGLSRRQLAILQRLGLAFRREIFPPEA